MFDGRTIVRPSCFAKHMQLQELRVGDVMLVEFGCDRIIEEDDYCEMQFKMVAGYVLSKR